MYLELNSLSVCLLVTLNITKPDLNGSFFIKIYQYSLTVSIKVGHTPNGLRYLIYFV